METVHGVALGEEKMGKFECEQCHKEYKNLDTLRQHKKIKKHMEFATDSVISDQEDLVKYKCEDCKNLFASKYSLQRHQKLQLKRCITKL